MSAPPDSSASPARAMSGQSHERPAPAPEHSHVRHIPIFVEGRDEPVLSRAGAPAPDQHAPPLDRDQYFADDGPPGFHHPPNFSRAFGTPFNKGYRQGPQPFTQQKAYPQAAFARAASPQRAASPRAHHDEHFVKVPVQHDQHEQPAARPQPPPQRQPPPAQQPPRQPSPQKERTPPPRPQPASNDPISQILGIQTDVLNLMTEVENFAGTKKDKRYLFLDEMLTRNLIKLDNIETDGKENIRQARKEAIKCIQKCIAVLEAKADGNKALERSHGDVDMKENPADPPPAEAASANGEVEMKADENAEPSAQTEPAAPATQPEEAVEPKVEDKKPVAKTQEQPSAVAPETKEVTQAQAADTRPEDTKATEPQNETEGQKDNVDKPSPKKGTKVVKKRNKSKDNKDRPKDSDNKEENEADSVKEQKPAEVTNKKENVEVMQVDDKGDKTEQVMEVDGAASQ